MAHLIDLFTQLRDIIYNRGICAKSSELASVLQAEVSYYFDTATPHLTLRDRQIARDIVERVDSLMIIIIGVDLSTHNGFWISRLNNLQTDLFHFLRKVKSCGRENTLNFGNWYSMYGVEYSKKSQAYQTWICLKDQRNHLLNLTNLPITRQFKARVNLAAFKGVYITKKDNSGKSSMTKTRENFEDTTTTANTAIERTYRQFDMVNFSQIKLQKSDHSSSPSSSQSSSLCDSSPPPTPLSSMSSYSASSLETSLTTRPLRPLVSSIWHLAYAILPYNDEIGVPFDDWQYAQATFNDPDDIRLINTKKRDAVSQYHKLETMRLIKKYDSTSVSPRRLAICRNKLELLCDWLDNDAPIIVD